MQLPKLFKCSSSGKITFWSIEINNDSYTISHGYVDGAVQEKTTKIMAGKGKKNVSEQTIAEATSKWNKQKDRKGYTETVPKNPPLRPMLAQSYNYPGADLSNIKPCAKHIKQPFFVQPKLDGLRCLSIKKGKDIYLMSRQGKLFTSLQHIKNRLIDLMEDGDIWDGELYLHGEEFQKIISAVKRDDPSDKTSSIQYHVYDCVKMADFEDRFKYLKSHIPQDDNPKIRVVDLVWTKEIQSADDVERIHKEQTLRGYEGIMLRNKKGAYEIDHRSKNLQKVKVFCEEEFEIIGAKESPKMPGTCSFVCKTKDGAEFSCMPEGSEYEREKYWEDWLGGKIVVGDLLTVKFFAWTTSDKKVPRFPVGKMLRSGASGYE